MGAEIVVAQYKPTELERQKKNTQIQFCKYCAHKITVSLENFVNIY